MNIIDYIFFLIILILSFPFAILFKFISYLSERLEDVIDFWVSIE